MILKRQRKFYRPDPDAPGKVCDMPGCSSAGEYKAPRSREALNDYRWFCLEHVREYNKSWDFYKGMSPVEIENMIRLDQTWQRSGLPFGSGADPDSLLQQTENIYRNIPINHTKVRGKDGFRLPEEVRQALAVLELEWPVSQDEVKKRYRILAKSLHPDTNKKEPQAAEKFTTINLAYTALCRYFKGQE